MFDADYTCPYCGGASRDGTVETCYNPYCSSLHDNVTEEDREYYRKWRCFDAQEEYAEEQKESWEMLFK